MALQKIIIAFGQIASIAAQNVGSVEDPVRPTCIVDLNDRDDAILCAKHVLEKHRHGDSYLFIYSKVDELSHEYAEVFRQFLLGVDSEIPHELLEVTERHALNDEVGEEFINRHLDRLKFGVKNSHEHRNQKNGFFDVGWFTPGTVFGYSVDSYGAKKGEISYLQVDHVSTNGPNSFLVITTEDDHPVIGGKKMINISHVKSIVRQVPGQVKWCQSRSEQYRDDFFGKESRSWHFPNVKAKHPSQYRSYDPRQLILHIAKPMVPNGQILDLDKMANQIVAMNVFKRTIINPECDFARLALHTINKKRLKNIIRRMLNKCLSDVKKAADEYEKMMSEMDRMDDAFEERDLEADDRDNGVPEDDDYSSRSGRSERHYDDFA